MRPYSAGEVADIVKGTVTRGNRNSIITAVLDDPDLMTNPNTLFFLKKNTEKHWDSIKKCPPCVVIAANKYEQFNSIDGCTVILVDNVDKAFWAFVEYYRGLFDIPVVAVTGTTGKTTTKDMIMHILSYYWDVVGTDKSGNTLAKNCRYLFGIGESTDAAVIETAVSHPGVLAHSCRMFKPTLGIITNIGIDHTEGCRNLEGYIKAKAEMLPGLGNNGVLLVNADDENTK
jgi:UDP-N-acetylmuramoyl-tripeptide--D-alanyl-D-alanine ligase